MNDGSRGRFVLALAVGVALGSVAGLANAQSDAGVPGFTEPPWGGWHTEQIDPGTASAGDIAFTSEGEPRVAYTQGFEGVRVARPTVTGWDTVVIEKMSSPGSLAIDTDDRVWVGYKRGHAEPPFHKVKIAWSDAGSEDWTIETVDEGRHVAMALGGDGQPHLLYRQIDGDQYLFRHAQRTGSGTYAIDTIQTGKNIVSNFWQPSLTSGPDGSLHAVFQQNKAQHNFQERYAMYDPGTEQWSYAWLDACTRATEPDVAVEATGRVHVACHSDVEGLVHYTRDPATETWSWQVAATGWDVVPTRFNKNMGLDPSIAVTEDAVHFSWRTTYNPGFPDDPTAPAHLYYTSYVDGAYTTEPVDASGNGIGWESAITTDEEGRPWIIYEYLWRTRSLDRGEHVNPGYAIYVAHPTTALLDAPS